MSSPEEFYTLDQIEEFLLTEHPAVHGTSPLVYQQNRVATQLLKIAAGIMGPSVLGVQLLGSRAHGYARATSDFDTHIMSYGEGNSVPTDFRGMVRPLLLSSGLEIDSGAASYILGIRAGIPRDPAQFIGWASRNPITTTGMYESGVFQSKSLRICAAAGAEAIAASDNPQQTWDTVREWHARGYLGEAGRLREKLSSSQLPYGATAVEQRFTDTFMAERVRRLGLPATFETYYETSREWMAVQEIGAIEAPAAELYEQVRATTGG